MNHNNDFFIPTVIMIKMEDGIYIHYSDTCTDTSDCLSSMSQGQELFSGSWVISEHTQHGTGTRLALRLAHSTHSHTHVTEQRHCYYCSLLNINNYKKET